MIFDFKRKTYFLEKHIDNCATKQVVENYCVFETVYFLNFSKNLFLTMLLAGARMQACDISVFDEPKSASNNIMTLFQKIIDQ